MELGVKAMSRGYGPSDGEEPRRLWWFCGFTARSR